MSVKMPDGNDLPHELLLTKLRNTFNNNMSTDLMLSKAQISKTIQYGGFLVAWLIKLASLLMKVAISFSKKKCFSSIRNNSSCLSNWSRSSK